METNFDCIVVGAGPAGLSAALNLRQRGKTVLVVHSGETLLAKAEQVDNYLGMPGLSGKQMMERFTQHARDAGAVLRKGRAGNVMPFGGRFMVNLDGDILETGAVVLACGGFPHDRQRLAQVVPHAAEGYGHFSAAPPDNQGEGIRLGESVGGQFDTSLRHPLAWAPVSRVTLASGQQLMFPHLVERAKPGVIAVLPNGKRFVNEADSYHDFIAALLAATPAGDTPQAWLLADRRTLRRYGLGHARPFPFTPTAWLRTGYLQRGNTLAELAKQSAHESTLRNAVLVESVQGLEDIKLMQAENRFLQQWNSYIQITAESDLRTRELTQNLISWGMTIQSLVYAGVIVVGAPMVIDGTLTTGSVVAASMLASRMIAPMATLCGVLARWQQVKAAKEGLDSIMQLPTENQREETPIRQDVLRGHYLFEQAQFRYHPEDPRMALRINRLEIKAGEKVAILGRNGAGKSTLLQAMAGGMDLAGGELRLDNLSLPHLDVADVRRNVGFMTQNARLFYGTLRENITLGMPRATDKEIFEVLDMCGAASFVQKLPKGLDYPIMENGVGLSGGQRQSILLARMLLRDPNIVLMDEPTASLDEHTEREFIQRLGAWLGNRTLIVATHRVPVLELVERVVVLKDGMLVMDAPKAQALNNSRMQQQQQATGREWKNENQSA